MNQAFERVNRTLQKNDIFCQDITVLVRMELRFFEGIVSYFLVISISIIKLQSKISNCVVSFWNQILVAQDHRDNFSASFQ